MPCLLRCTSSTLFCHLLSLRNDHSIITTQNRAVSSLRYSSLCCFGYFHFPSTSRLVSIHSSPFSEAVQPIAVITTFLLPTHPLPGFPILNWLLLQGGAVSGAVTLLDSRSSGLELSASRGHCVVFLGKTLYPHSASLSILLC